MSVVIPVRNGQAYLGEALASVAAQTADICEILVIDDGSTDATAAVARGFADPRRRYMVQPPAGAAAARNRGVAEARGALIAFLDADDLWLPEKLTVQLASLGRGDGDMIGGLTSEFVSPELPPAAAAELQPRGQPLPGPTATTLLIRRADFARIGPFDPALRVGEVIDWYARAIDAGLTGHIVPQVLARRRLHETNSGRSRNANRSHYAHLMKGILDRRRAAQAGPA